MWSVQKDDTTWIVSSQTVCHPVKTESAIDARREQRKKNEIILNNNVPGIKPLATC